MLTPEDVVANESHTGVLEVERNELRLRIERLKHDRAQLSVILRPLQARLSTITKSIANQKVIDARKLERLRELWQRQQNTINAILYDPRTEDSTERPEGVPTESSGPGATSVLTGVAGSGDRAT